MRMANRVAAAALQYSKWLSRFICWTWAIYRFAILIVAAIQPSVAPALVNTTAGMDTIMMVNISTYLVNSLGEKWLYSDRAVIRWIDKGGFKHLIGNITSKIINREVEEATQEEEEEIIDGGEEDGDDQNG